MNRTFVVLSGMFLLATGLAFGQETADPADTSMGQKLPEFLQPFDTDGDGKLSDTEREAAEAARKEMMLKKFDTDGDGILSEDEKAKMPQKGPGMGNAEHLKQFDTDGDGKLSDTEREAAQAKRKEMMLKKFDTDGDGTLSETEKANLPKKGLGQKPQGQKPGKPGKGGGKRRFQ